MVATLYVHGSREHAYDVGQKLGLTGKALELFSFAACEIKLTLNVNETTGEAWVTHMNDRRVEENV
jgi:hypothetical protein